MVDYDPVTGVGATGERVTVGPSRVTGGRVEYVPVEMTADGEFGRVKSRAAWDTHYHA